MFFGLCFHFQLLIIQAGVVFVHPQNLAFICLSLFSHWISECSTSKMHWDQGLVIILFNINRNHTIQTLLLISYYTIITSFPIYGSLWYIQMSRGVPQCVWTSTPTLILENPLPLGRVRVCRGKNVFKGNTRVLQAITIFVGLQWYNSHSVSLSWC